MMIYISSHPTHYSYVLYPASIFVYYTYISNQKIHFLHNAMMIIICSLVKSITTHFFFNSVKPLSVQRLPLNITSFIFWRQPQTFLVQAFKFVVDSWKFNMLLLYILWDDWPISMISGSKEQLLQQLEYILLKSDCHDWWISKMQSDILEERYAKEFCVKLVKNTT